MSEKKRNELVKESNNLSIIVVLALFLICSLGYIAYDKYYSDFSTSNSSVNVKDVKKSGTKQTAYNKDGIFIKKLMKKAVIHSGFNHAEYELYLNDKVMATDLSEKYKNELIINNIGRSSFTIRELEDSSIEVFGKNVYTNYPIKLEKICRTYNLNDNYYLEDMNSGGCGGAGYQYLETIEKVTSDENHIYVYNRVGYRCPKGVCTGIHQGVDQYTYDKVVKEITANNELEYYNTVIDLEEIKDQLDVYKFTFTYDSNNNIYYFESVEKEK